MSVGIWPVRREAAHLAETLAASLPAEVVRPWLQPGRQRDFFAASFSERPAWVLIMATGIAVRFLDGLPRDKHTDPAVVVVDEGGRFAISLLSGHEGGANRLAMQVANALGATPVITTATEAVRPLTVGIGCRRGVPAASIEAAVRSVLGDRPLTEIRQVATVDLKADEAGLLAFCQAHDLPLRIFDRSDLAERPFVTRPSAWVEQHTGAVGICEPVALLASPRGRLIVPKTAHNGVAVAVVEDTLR
jgi:cobalt-precorrin 5A hydrolase